MRSLFSKFRSDRQSRERPDACSFCDLSPISNTIGFSANNTHCCRKCIERLCGLASQRVHGSGEGTCPDSSLTAFVNENRAKLTRMGWAPPTTLSCAICSRLTFSHEIIEFNRIQVCVTCVCSFGDALETELFRRGEIERPSRFDAPTVELEPGGWIRCPECAELFSVHHSRSWTGIRHRRCRQLIRIAT